MLFNKSRLFNFCSFIFSKILKLVSCSQVKPQKLSSSRHRFFGDALKTCSAMNVPFKNTVFSWLFRKIVDFNKSKDGANRENNAEIFLQTQEIFYLSERFAGL